MKKKKKMLCTIYRKYNQVRPIDISLTMVRYLFCHWYTTLGLWSLNNFSKLLGVT